MSGTTAARPASTTTTTPAASAAGAGAGRRERAIVRAGAAVLALHVIDDTLVQPPAGTPASDHLVSAALPVALIALAAWAYPRLRGPARGALGLVLGVLAIAVAAEALHYTMTVGPSGDDFTGLLTLAAGPVLMGTGLVTLWRTRRTQGNLVWRYGRRGLLAAGTVVFVSLVLLPLGLAYVTTHAARSAVPENRLGVAYEDVRFTTSDGLELRGWYVPSRNGAAVIAFPGRNGPQRQARMLARHGYGVLLFDRRGEGRSEGEPNAWGWSGERDVFAAIAWLKHRPDVDPRRIGGIGLSVGGEMMIEAAAESRDLAAVVSEGAGARAFSDEMQHDVPPVEQALGVILYGVRTASVAVFANQTPPRNLRDLVGRIAPRPLMLIADPESGNGEDLSRGYYRAAGQPKALWEIPGAGHVRGIVARPAEYERRVVGFFDRALLR
jgi:alpha/beta superfamily hydrolase